MIFQSKIPLARMWHKKVWPSNTHYILFLLSQFYVKKKKFLFWNLLFYRKNHLALLKDRYPEKMFIKRLKPHRLFSKYIGPNNYFTLIENDFWFLFFVSVFCLLLLLFFGSEVWICSITVTVHSGHMGKGTQLWTLKGELHPLTKISMFSALSPNYQHLFEKWYVHLIGNCPRNSKNNIKI